MRLGRTCWEKTGLGSFRLLQQDRDGRSKDGLDIACLKTGPDMPHAWHQQGLRLATCPQQALKSCSAFPWYMKT